MSEAAPDQAAREAALDPSRSFVVQAPAGSGKTGLLTQRFLRLLATVDAPEQIVAITFTRKAAAQMRHQVIQALAEARTTPIIADAHTMRTRELGRAALERAESSGWTLAAHPARLRIQTIDAFCHWLAAQLPMLARAGAELQVAEDPQPLYNQAARRTLALLDERQPVAAAVGILLRHRDNHLVQTETLLIDMLRKRDQWLPLIVGLEGQSLRERLDRDLAIEVTRGLQTVEQQWPAANLRTVARLAAFAARNLGESAGDLAPWRDLEGVPRPSAADLPLWRGLARLLLTGGRAWRRRVDKRDGIPASAREENEWIRALIEELSRVAGLEDVLGTVRFLPPPCLSDEQWQVAEALLSLLKVAAAELELVFRERGEVDHVAVAHAAVRALGNADEPGELALALDYRIRHLLVDEFQDSSHTQLRLLEALTAGWIDGDGRTLFCVGDPMQSIYRFRQAEVGLFLRTRDQGLGTIRPLTLALERNFRSAPELVQWFNDVFARALPTKDDLERGAVCHALSVAAREARGSPAVAVHCRFAADLLAEAAEIAALVASYRERAPGYTIGVLVRQRQHAVHVASVLREQRIRFQAVELEPLIGQPVVRDLLALSRALLHLGDRTAWLALLRSPLCGLTLADLEALTRDADRRPCWALLHDAERVTTLSADGQARVRATLAVLEGARTLSGRTSLRAWVERTWLSLGGPAAITESRALADAAAFFERLDQVERGGLIPAGDAFDGVFSDLFAPPDPAAPPELQLMTIHKAKGLEFDVVILPGIGRGRSRSAKPLLRWLEIPRPQGESGLLLAPIERKGARGDALFDYLSFRERERESFERARLMYVAATRAREALHLFGHVKASRRGNGETLGEPESRSLLALLWPSVRNEFEESFARRPSGTGPVEITPPRSPASIARHASGWRLPPPPPSVEARRLAGVGMTSPLGRPEFDWVGETSRRIGTVVHAELERWSRLLTLPSAQAIEARRAYFRRELVARGVPAEHIASGVERIVQALLNTCTDARGRWIFDPTHREARCEYALSGVADGQIVNAVIDRTFIDSAGIRWIVDFKTGRHEGGAIDAFLDREVERYRPQLARYARLVGGLASTPTAVRVGLYFPLLGGWREWTP